MTFYREFKTGNTSKQCPNCGYYRVVAIDWFELERSTEPYYGWKWWKSEQTTVKEVASGEGFGCQECGWKDRQGVGE